MCTSPFYSRPKRDRDLEARDRGRDRGVDNSSRGETETKAFRARDRDEAEAYQLRGETEPRHYCASRRPRYRGVKTEATSLWETVLYAAAAAAAAAADDDDSVTGAADAFISAVCYSRADVRPYNCSSSSSPVSSTLAGRRRSHSVCPRGSQCHIVNNVPRCCRFGQFVYTVTDSQLIFCLYFTELQN